MLLFQLKPSVTLRPALNQNNSHCSNKVSTQVQAWSSLHFQLFSVRWLLSSFPPLINLILKNQGSSQISRVWAPKRFGVRRKRDGMDFWKTFGPLHLCRTIRGSVPLSFCSHWSVLVKNIVVVAGYPALGFSSFQNHLRACQWKLCTCLYKQIYTGRRSSHPFTHQLFINEKKQHFYSNLRHSGRTEVAPEWLRIGLWKKSPFFLLICWLWKCISCILTHELVTSSLP